MVYLLTPVSVRNKFSCKHLHVFETLTNSWIINIQLQIRLLCGFTPLPTYVALESF